MKQAVAGYETELATRALQREVRSWIVQAALMVVVGTMAWMATGAAR